VVPRPRQPGGVAMPHRHPGLSCQAPRRKERGAVPAPLWHIICPQNFLTAVIFFLHPRCRCCAGNPPHPVAPPAPFSTSTTNGVIERAEEERGVRSDTVQSLPDQAPSSGAAPTRMHLRPHGCESPLIKIHLYACRTDVSWSGGCTSIWDIGSPTILLPLFSSWCMAIWRFALSGRRGGAQVCPHLPRSGRPEIFTPFAPGGRPRCGTSSTRRAAGCWWPSCGRTSSARVSFGSHGVRCGGIGKPCGGVLQTPSSAFFLNPVIKVFECQPNRFFLRWNSFKWNSGFAAAVLLPPRFFPLGVPSQVQAAPAAAALRVGDRRMPVPRWPPRGTGVGPACRRWDLRGWRASILTHPS